MKKLNIITEIKIILKSDLDKNFGKLTLPEIKIVAEFLEDYLLRYLANVLIKYSADIIPRCHIIQSGEILKIEGCHT